MKIVNAIVKWNERYDNDPHFEVLVDQLPESVYEQTSDNRYESRTGGLVNALYCSDGHGFAGRDIPITLTDGTVKVLRGPYSFDKIDQTCKVSITDDPAAFKRGHTFMSSSMALDGLEECARIAGVWLAEVVDSGGFTRYVPTLRNSIPKGIGTRASCRDVKWRYVYPHSDDWFYVREKDNSTIKRLTMSTVVGVLRELDKRHPSDYAVNVVSHATDIGGLDRMTALVKRGVTEQEWEACRLLMQLATKEYQGINSNKTQRST